MQFENPRHPKASPLEQIQSTKVVVSESQRESLDEAPQACPGFAVLRIQGYVNNRPWLLRDWGCLYGGYESKGDGPGQT